MTSARHRFAGLPADLPQPGAGRTAERFARLWEIAATDPTLGRLAEAHYDGRAILREADREPSPGSTWGVWAARGPDPATIEGGRLTGAKSWCSGATLLSHALVTARHGDADALVAVDLADPGVRMDPPAWRSPALADADTRTVRFDLEVGPGDIVGDDGWYLSRPGFWHGAVGVAACWAGCVDGVVRRVIGRWPQDPHALAHLGAIDSGLWTMRAALRAAGDEIDRDPIGDEADRRRRRLRVRHLVDVTVGDITTRLARAVGPGPLAHVPELHASIAACDLYRRQCHGERDLAELGALATLDAEREGRRP